MANAPRLAGLSGSSDVETGQVTLVFDTTEGTFSVQFPIEESWKVISQVAAAQPMEPGGKQIGPQLPMAAFGLIEATSNSPIQIALQLSTGAVLRVAIQREAAEKMGRDLTAVAERSRSIVPAKKH